MFILLLLILIFIVLYPINRKKAISYKNIMLDNFIVVGIIAFIVGLAISIAGFEDSAVNKELTRFVAALIIGSPFLLPRMIVRLINRKKSRAVNNGQTGESEIPDSFKERAGIVRKFNEKNKLNLTGEEIEKIVGGSFTSSDWAKEIAAMNRTYSSDSEWYNSETGWLRAYLKVFNVQEVSSDFMMQREICFNNFNDIFNSLDMESFYSIEDCIQSVNNRFMTNFDDVSFMIAYRFLEKNGRTYELPIRQVVGVDDELEEIKNKYTRQTE